MADGTKATTNVIRLSIWEKLDLIPAFLSVITSVFYNVVAGIFRGKAGAKLYSVHVGHAIVRKFLTRFSMRQTLYLNFPTRTAYKLFTKRERLKPETVTLRHGASGHWVGNKDAKNVVIYYHGGGFTLAASPTHFNFYYSEIVKPFNAAGKDVAFFFLEYTLTPHAAYPTQLRQAVEALRYILKDTSRDPSSVIIGGDSAGGNLTLSVLLHIAHPHPDIEPLDLGDENAKLGGAFLCAPWVSFRTDWPSGQTNKYKDVINAECGDRWSSAYLNGKQGDSWSEPFLAPVDWWKNFRAEHVIFITGTDELLYSAIEAFVKKFKMVNPDTAYVAGHEETHVAHVYSSILTGKETEQGKALKAWFAARYE